MSVSEETFSKVQEVLVEALGVEDDEVTAEATMINDLGAESIDFLDIVFKLEQAFGISIDRPRVSLSSKSGCRSRTWTNLKPIRSSRILPICLPFRTFAGSLNTSKPNPLTLLDAIWFSRLSP